MTSPNDTPEPSSSPKPTFTATILKGKVAFVTGTSSGIGLATTIAFLTAGASVFGVDISPFPEPSPLPSDSKFAFHRVNLLEKTAADESIAACIDRFGPRIDVLANVAGVMDNFEGADTITPAQWERVMGVNAAVPVRLMSAVLNAGGMKEHRSGSIINVASKAGISGAAAGIAYTASKHAVVGATKNVAWRFKNEGIRCNAVCPGAVKSNMNLSIDRTKIDQELHATIKPGFEIMNKGSPDITTDDIANAILFLASDASRMINGVILPVDTAWSAM